MKTFPTSFTIAEYTIDSYFVIAAICCFVLSFVLPEDRWLCIAAMFVNLFLVFIDMALNNYKGKEE